MTENPSLTPEFIAAKHREGRRRAHHLRPRLDLMEGLQIDAAQSQHRFMDSEQARLVK